MLFDSSLVLESIYTIMKSLLLFAFTLILFDAICQSFPDGKILRVIDGDTYVVSLNGVSYHCRLVNVDAPEKDQPFGLKVRDSASSFILGKDCQVIIVGFDVYNRALTSISVNHISLDSLLLARGWAWYTPSMIAFKPELRSIEANSRINNIGLWSCTAAIPPWIWRSMNWKDKRLYNLCR